MLASTLDEYSWLLCYPLFPLIRFQRIYNFELFHAIILSVLDVLYALLCYFILFLGLTY